MSGYVTGWVLKHSETEGATRLVLVVLADHASSDGTDSYPTIEVIQHEARLRSRRSVQTALRTLEALGAIEAAGKGSKGQTNWTVLLGGGAVDAPPGAQSTTQGGAIDDTGGRNLRPRASDLGVNRPLNRPEPSSAARGEGSGEIDIPVQRRLGEDNEPVPLLSEPGQVEAVWAHYVDVMAPRDKELHPAERALIREALKVATLPECKAAIDGCHASTFHMGENDRGKKYNRLSQIIKGKRGGRTTREQIDFFMDIAEVSGVAGVDTSVDPHMLNEAKRNVLTAWEFPGNELAREVGDQSAAWLAQHGYDVVPDGEDCRPTFVRRLA